MLAALAGGVSDVRMFNPARISSTSIRSGGVAAIWSGSVGSNWFGGVGGGKMPEHCVSYHVLLARDVPVVTGHYDGPLQYQKKVISENMTKICTFSNFFKTFSTDLKSA